MFTNRPPLGGGVQARSIEDSLALIQHHVAGLSSTSTSSAFNSSSSSSSSSSSTYGGVPPPPPSSPPTALPPVCPSVAPYLAPPPGFSDSEHSASDCDSLGSVEGGGFQRFVLSLHTTT